MSKLKSLNLIPPSEESDFVKLCLELWNRILGDPHTQLNGRRGQKQNGVDIFGRRAMGTDWVGIQCKVRTSGLITEKEIQDDVERAKCFNPRLSELVFATTTPRDEKLQAFARQLTECNIMNGLFSVSIASWSDIQLELSEESNIDILKRFYGDFFINYERMGIAISRIIRISVGVGQTPDTSYELLIGKTPLPSRPESYGGLDYWKGVYFLACWQNGSLTTFRQPIHHSRLCEVIKFRRDAIIVAKWLSDIESIDDIIYGEQDEHVSLISDEEYKEYFSSSED